MKERIEQILDENLDSTLIYTLIEGYEVNITGKERAAEEIERPIPKVNNFLNDNPKEAGLYLLIGKDSTTDKYYYDIGTWITKDINHCMDMWALSGKMMTVGPEYYIQMSELIKLLPERK